MSNLICHFTQAPSFIFYLLRFIPFHISFSSLRLLCSVSTPHLLFNFVQSCRPFKAFLSPQPLSTSHTLSRPLNFLLTFVDPAHLSSLFTSVPSCLIYPLYISLISYPLYWNHIIFALSISGTVIPPIFFQSSSASHCLLKFSCSFFLYP